MRPMSGRVLLLLLTCAFTACDSGDNAAPDPLDTLAPTNTLPAARTTAAPLATTSDTAAPLTSPAGALALSADGPWKLVDSAPGITTPGLVYELMPGLWAYLPTVEDIPNGITWVLNKDDLPVIEAYLMARLTYYRAVTSHPMDFTSPDWAKYYTDGGARLRTVFEPMSALGQAADLSAGVVLRPTVAGENRSETSALVLDCTLDGGVIRNLDGSLAPGSTLGTSQSGVAASFKSSSHAWVLDRINDEVSGACV